VHHPLERCWSDASRLPSQDPRLRHPTWQDKCLERQYVKALIRDLVSHQFGGVPSMTKRAGSGSATLPACWLLHVSWRASSARSSNASVLLAGAGLARASVAASIPCGGISRHRLYLSSSLNYHSIYHCHFFHSIVLFFLFRIARIRQPRPIACAASAKAILYCAHCRYILHSPGGTIMPDISLTNVTFSTGSDVYFTILIVSLQPPSSC